MESSEDRIELELGPSDVAYVSELAWQTAFQRCKACIDLALEGLPIGSRQQFWKAFREEYPSSEANHDE